MSAPATLEPGAFAPSLLDQILEELRTLKAMLAKSSEPSPSLISRADAAKRLGVRRERVAELIRIGKLPTVKVGRHDRISVAALEQLIESGDLSTERRGRPRKPRALPSDERPMPIRPIR